MSKEVELKITIKKDGTVEVVPSGTVGKECLDLMKFLDKVPGLNVTSTKENDDMKKTSHFDNSVNVKPSN
jgi:acylphosphatase